MKQMKLRNQQERKERRQQELEQQAQKEKDEIALAATEEKPIASNVVSKPKPKLDHPMEDLDETDAKKSKKVTEAIISKPKPSNLDKFFTKALKESKQKPEIKQFQTVSDQNIDTWASK